LEGEEVIITEYFNKAMKSLLMSFTQKRSTRPSNTNPAFHAMPTQPFEIFIKGGAEIGLW